MNKIFVTTLLAVLSVSLNVTGQEEKDKIARTDERAPLRSVNEMPEFPGGKTALASFLSSTLEYPDEAARAGVEGQVVVEFIVDAEGYSKNYKIKKSLGYGCDEEVMRVLKQMPRWRPGMQNGKKVSVYYTLPVTFKLPKKDIADAPAHKDTVLRSVQQLPMYPGGKEALARFLRDNISYPQEAAKYKIQGQVIVEFVVDERGNISNIQFKKRLGYGCDQEVIRVLNAMPPWQPGKQDGVPVPVYYLLPVTFKLSK